MYVAMETAVNDEATSEPIWEHKHRNFLSKFIFFSKIPKV